MRTLRALVLVWVTVLALALTVVLCGAQQMTTYVPNMQLSLLRGLTNWWRGVPGRTGGTTLYNLVPGSLNHGTLTAMGFGSTSGWSARTRSGTAGGSQLNFDGVDDYVQTAEPANVSVAAPFTLCVWLNSLAAATGGLQRVILRQSNPNSYSGVYLHWGENNTGAQVQRPNLSINTNSGGSNAIRSNVDRPLNTWEHLCATYDGSQTTAGMALWVNGGVLSTFVETNSGFGAFNNNPWRIGASTYTPVDSAFQGAMESIMTWSRALSAAEIQALYQTGLQGDLPLFVSPLDVLAAPAGTAGSFLPFFR